jgi:uncharacterized protein YaaN involved in tellurite resistance
MVTELTPPIALTPPEPVAPVPQEQAGQMIRLDQATIEKLDVKVQEFSDSVVNSQVNSNTFEERLTAVHNFGIKEIRASATVSNRILERPVKALESGVFNEGSQISRSLLDLRKTIEELDPSRQGDLLSVNKLFGMLPFGNRIQNYFLKYQSSQGHINAIIDALYRGQDELRKDNATIEQEKGNLWNLMLQLQQFIYVGKKIDASLDARVADIEVNDPEKARVIREELLFYVRQKVQDLLTQLAVNIQGYLALDVIRKNNLELIKGVDRATTTTISALRTAVIVAQALANQKLVLDQISALNTTTSNLILSTSELLKQQSGDIHRQATTSGVELGQLQAAFDNIYETIYMISQYKLDALGTMQQTVSMLSSEVEKANAYLDRVRSDEAAQMTVEMNLLEPDTEIGL